MKEYCLGFLFSEERDKVCLIRKNRPEWQQGKLNGIGGKVEIGEVPMLAMHREGKEEIGLFLPWLKVGLITSKDYCVHVFMCFSEEIERAMTMTDEEVVILEVSKINEEDNCIENLKSLISLCLLDDGFDTFVLNYL